MDINNENQIDGKAAKALRERAGLSQAKFWAAYGVQQPGGWRYENGTRIPRAIRRLIFAEHIAGLKLDASTDEGAQRVCRIGQVIAADQIVAQARRVLSAINE